MVVIRVSLVKLKMRSGMMSSHRVNDVCVRRIRLGFLQICCWRVYSRLLICLFILCWFVFFFQAEDGIRDVAVTGVQTCALPICTTDILI